MTTYSTQNELILYRLNDFYSKDNFKNLKKVLPIINGESPISLRIIDWFVTNYSKKHFTQYNIIRNGATYRFKVHHEYKLKLRSYKKKRFDPFCRWERIIIPYENNTRIQTTIGQLNFFEWCLKNKIMDYIEKHTGVIDDDMNNRNTLSKNVTSKNKEHSEKPNKTRKKRQELSISATKSIKKENVEIIVQFK
jgi:hypothetical protein